MSTTVTLDKAGRVVLPKPLRDELRLEPGDKLELESEGEQVTLRPIRTAAPLKKERGIWVFRKGGKLPADATSRVLKAVREGRDRRNAGSAG